MSNSKFVPAPQVRIVNDKGTRLRVSAALASKMRGYTLVGRAKTAATTASPASADGTPSESWTVKQLTAYAATNEIDLAGATRKDDILDVLAATADPNNVDDGQDDEDDDLDGQDDDDNEA